MSTSKATTAEQNPVEVPLYTHWDAARYLHVPLWGVFTLSGRYRGWPDPELFFYHSRRGFPDAAIFDDDPAFPPHEDRQRLSFQSFATLFVRAATFQVLAEWSRISHEDRDRWESLYRAIWRGLEDTHREPVPFAGSTDDRVAKLVAPYDGRLSDEQLLMLRKWFTFRLERVDVQDGTPLRLYPISRDPSEAAPRTIVLDPRVRFGRPTVARRGIPTDSIFERFQAGDSLAELAEDYSLTTSEVEEAIRYEATPPVPLLPFYGW